MQVTCADSQEYTVPLDEFAPVSGEQARQISKVRKGHDPSKKPSCPFYNYKETYIQRNGVFLGIGREYVQDAYLSVRHTPGFQSRGVV